jgi:hypothetical protein
MSIERIRLAQAGDDGIPGSMIAVVPGEQILQILKPGPGTFSSAHRHRMVETG